MIVLHLALLVLLLFVVLSGARALPLWAPAIAFVVFGFFWLLLSVAVLEQGAYIFEQARMSHANGSYLLLYGYLIFFFFGYFVAAGALDSFMRPIEAKLRSYAFGSKEISARALEALLFYGLTLLLLMMILHTVASGSPLLGTTNATKTKFWSSAALVPQLQIINNQLHPLAFAFAVVARKQIRVVIFAAICSLHFALLGYKFSLVLVTLYMASYPALQHVSWERLLSARVFSGVAIVLLTITSLTYLSYSKTVAGGAAEIIRFTADRILVLQGHTWWGIVEFVNAHGAIGGLERFFFEDSMKFIMRLIAPPSIAEHYIESGSSFTAAFPGLMHLTLGHWALLLQAPLGAGFAILVLAVHRWARHGFVAAFLSMKLFMYVWYVLISGSTAFLSDTDMLIYLALLLAYFVFLNVNRRLGRPIGVSG